MYKTYTETIQTIYKHMQQIYNKYTNTNIYAQTTQTIQNIENIYN